jgi:hypothetical protein
MDLLPSNVIEAQIAKMEQDEIIIRALKKKNERLAAERLEAELEASIEIAKAKFAQAQAFQRMVELEKRVAELATIVDAQAQLLAGEYRLLHQDYYAHSARCGC